MKQRFYEKLTNFHLVVKYLSLLSSKIHFRKHDVPPPVSILRKYTTLKPISSRSTSVSCSHLETDIRFKFASQNVFVFYTLTCSPYLEKTPILD